MTTKHAFLALAIAAAATVVVAHPDDEKATFFTTETPLPMDGVAGFPALNVELLSNIPAADFDTGANFANDCWGYAAPSGREYAIIGLHNAVGFVDITDPVNPVIVDTFPWANNCPWYDIKVFQDHAYAVTDCANGLRTYDMSQIDAGVVTHVDTDVDVGSTSHNVALDTASGYLFRTGGGAGGLLIYDLNEDPGDPTLVAQWPDRYVHDAWPHTYTSGPYAGREIVFCYSGFNGGGVETGIDVLDVTNKNDILLLDRYELPGASYSHQGCLSADRTLLYMGDETDGVCETLIIDVSDLENIGLVDTFDNGLSCIDHNQYVVGDIIYQANFQTGLRVFDASEPLAPVEIAYFDTYPQADGIGYFGLWSNYPYLPSGNVIGSGSGGLWVWRVTLPCAEDVTGDGTVGPADLAQVLDNWGFNPGHPADVNGDGVVGPADLAALLDQWGPC